MENSQTVRCVAPVTVANFVQQKGTIIYDKSDDVLKYSNGIKWKILSSSDDTSFLTGVLSSSGELFLQKITLTSGNVVYLDMTVIGISANSEAEIVNIKTGFKNMGGKILPICGSVIDRISDVSNIFIQAVQNGDTTLNLSLTNNSMLAYNISVYSTTKFLF
jgi:hypothetical protein